MKSEAEWVKIISFIEMSLIDIVLGRFKFSDQLVDSKVDTKSKDKAIFFIKK